MSHPAPITNNQQTTAKPKGKKQFKKFSAATLETINRLSTNELETHGIIQSARASGFVCPLCGSGEGSHGTGMTQNPKAEHTSLHCFGCGKSLNPLHLCALHYALDIRHDFPTLVEKICTDFGLMSIKWTRNQRE